MEVHVNKRVLVLVAGVLLVAGSLAAACTDSNTDDLEDQVTTLEQQVTTGSEQLTGTTAQAQANSMITALNILGGAGLHDLDVAANEEGTVPEDAAFPISSAIFPMQAADWPEDLQPAVDELLGTMEELVAALEAGSDAAVIGPLAVEALAVEAHDQQHDLEHESQSYIAESLGIPVEEEHEDEASETPAAGETPAEDHEEGETPAAGETPAGG
jgi:hypothetical protein